MTLRILQRGFTGDSSRLTFVSFSQLLPETIPASISVKYFQTAHLNSSLPPELSSFPKRSKYHHLFSIVLTHDKPWISKIINKSSQSQEAASKIIPPLLPGRESPARARAHFPTRPRDADNSPRAGAQLPGCGSSSLTSSSDSNCTFTPYVSSMLSSAGKSGVN